MNYNSSLLRTLYSSTFDKYIKFKTRLEKARQSGRFFTLSKTKQHSLIQRLQRLYEKLKSLQTQLRVSGVGAAIALALSAGTAEAQEVGPFERNDIENPLPAPYRVAIPKPVSVDIDNDGDLDVFVGDKYGNIHFFRNTAGPDQVRRFQREISSSLSTIDVGNRASPAFMDVDGDGDFDLLIGNSTGQTFFFRNNSTETALVFASVTGPSNPFNGINGTVGNYGPGPASPTFVNIDGDSDLDLVIGSSPQQTGKYSYNPAIKIYINNAGTFTLGDADDFGPLFTYDRLRPVFADIDGDGDLDIMAGNSGGVVTFLNTPGGFEVQEGPWNPTTKTGNPLYQQYLYGNTSPFLADFDGDGDLDLLIGRGGNYSRPQYSDPVAYFENTGNFVLERRDGLNLNPFDGVDVGDEAAPSFSDIDGDGDLDAILGNKYFFQLAIFVNEDGYFVYDEDHPLTSVETGDRSLPVFVDIDADGDQDMFISNNYETQLLENNNNVFSQKTSPLDLDDFSVPSLAFIDVDNDGDFDALAFNHDTDAIEFFRNTGSAQSPVFSQQTAPAPFNTLEFEWFVTKLKAVDIDHDGDLDLLVSESINDKYSYTGFRLFDNNGNGTFRDVSPTPFEMPARTYSIISFADIDGDDDLDVLIGTGDGGVEYYENTNPGPVTNVSLNSVSVTINTPAVLDPDLTIADDDDDALVQATVVISNYSNGNEVLDFTPSNGLTGEFEDGTLTIRGKSTIANYETLLRTVTYSFSGNVTAAREAARSAGVPPADKTVTFSVRDTDFTETIVSQVNIISLNLIGEPGAKIVVYNAVSPGVTSGLNDYMRIEGLPLKNKVTIFNRWGDQVFEISGYDNDTRRFEGKNDSGKELPSGTYFYSIEASNDKITGYLSLKR